MFLIIKESQNHTSNINISQLKNEMDPNYLDYKENDEENRNQWPNYEKLREKIARFKKN